MSKISPKWPGRAALCVMLALTALPSLARDPDDSRLPPPSLPEPNPVEVSVPRGGPVWITLSVYSLTSPIIRYRIKRQPKGTLGAPEIATPTTAVVKYQPPSGAGPDEDSFSYQVQSEAGVSAAEEVHIKITDKDPQLIAPDEIDFGELLPGESSKRTIELQNIGGGIAEGDVVVPDGWTVQGDTAYKLAAGAKQRFTLVFSPKEQRKYMGDVEYTGDLDRATDLDGMGVAPIEASAGPVELKQTGASRLGTIQVLNRTAVPQTLRVTTGPNVEAESSVNAPAKGAAQIIVRAKPDQLGPIRDHVTIVGEGIKTDVAVYAAAVPPPPTPAPIAVAATPTSSPAQAGQPAQASASAPSLMATQDDSDSLSSPSPDAEPLTEPAIQIWGLSVQNAGKRDARVICNFKGAPPAQSYRLEEQSVDLDAHGKPEALWQPLTSAKVRVNGSVVGADLDQLEPGQLYVVRLVGIDDQGRVIATSSSGEVWTIKPRDWGRLPWIALVAVVLVSLAAWQRMRRRW